MMGRCNISPLQMNVADHASSQWLTCFQDTGIEILGRSAEELGELRNQVRERKRGKGETNLIPRPSLPQFWITASDQKWEMENEVTEDCH